MRLQGRSQNLKEVPQNFTGFNVDDVATNDGRHREKPTSQRKKINLSSIVITDVKLALYLKKDLEFCFLFLLQEHLHSKISGAFLCVYVSITV